MTRSLPMTAFLTAVLLIAQATAEAKEPTFEQRPNVLLIMADDLGIECLGSYGGTSYHTPALDRMAARGLRFTNAFATPLCSTTRVELMTGQSSHRDWIGFGLLNPELRTFGHALQEAGYRTGIVGKWQLTSYDPPDYPGAESRRMTGMKPGDAGFDHFALFHTGHTEAKGSRYADPTLDFNGTVYTRAGAYGPDLIKQNAIHWIRKSTLSDANTVKEPWFLYYPMFLPHWPMTPTPDSDAWDDLGERHKPSTDHFPDMIRYMDKIVGEVLDEAETLSHKRPTLVLFYSDNGTHLSLASNTVDGWRAGGKGLSTDAGTRVPLIAFCPTHIAAGETDALVAPTDFYPTLLDIIGAEESTAHLDGVSFAPALVGGDGGRDTWTCVYEPRPGWDKDQFTKLVWTQDARYKLYSDGRFYDTSIDRYENRPLPIGERPAGVTEQLQQDMGEALKERPRP